MALPDYTFNDDFEDGTATGFDVAESDTSSQLDFPHYSVLARTPGLAMPYRGAYCARVVMAAGNTNDATFGDAQLGSLLTSETQWIQFCVWFSPDLLTGLVLNDDVVLMEIQSAGAVEFALGMRRTSATTVIWRAGQLTPNFSFNEIELGVWNTIDMVTNVVVGSAAGDLHIYATPDGGQPSETYSARAITVNNAASSTKAVFGVQNKDSGSTGTILYDNFKATAVDTGSRIYPQKNRFSTTQVLTKSGHVFVGPGTIASVTAIDGGGDASAVVTVYDTDTAQVHEGLRKLTLSADTAGQTVTSSTPFDVNRGCYVTIAGTTPVEATVNIERAPNWFSDGNIRRYAMRRSLQP